MRYLLTFSYDGTNYQGYQKQNNKQTIQDNIEENISKILNHETRISASGRTDAGVHAINQKAHFDSEKNLDLEKFRYSLNKLINNDIYIRNIEVVPHDFHARFNAVEKEYIYKINLGEYNPMERNHIYQYCKKLDIEKMKEAANSLIGTHNFKSYVKTDDINKDYVRTIYSIEFKLENDILEIIFKGNGFLRYMVRNMVGALIEVGSGKIMVNNIEETLKCEDRTKAGITAPPQGLYLQNVKYE